jgi:hypothetical protein
MKNGNPQRLVIKPHVETHGRACNQIKCIMHNCGEIQTSSTINHPSSIVNHQPSTINHQSNRGSKNRAIVERSFGGRI